MAAYLLILVICIVYLLMHHHCIVNIANLQKHLPKPLETESEVLATYGCLHHACSGCWHLQAQTCKYTRCQSDDDGITWGTCTLETWKASDSVLSVLASVSTDCFKRSLPSHWLRPLSHSYNIAMYWMHKGGKFHETLLLSIMPTDMQNLWK